jgi:hypothetical protein
LVVGKVDLMAVWWDMLRARMLAVWWDYYLADKMVDGLD